MSCETEREIYAKLFNLMREKSYEKENENKDEFMRQFF
jgi:hypothetical protein